MSEDRILEKLDGLSEQLADVRERLARLEGKAPPGAGGGGMAAGAGAAGAAIATLVQFLIQQFGG